MLRICAEHLTDDAEHQSVAVLGIALVVLGEDVGTEVFYPPQYLTSVTASYTTVLRHASLTQGPHFHSASTALTLSLLLTEQMSMRTFDHLLHYGELPVKRVVPLALALLYVSNPDYSVIDQLSRLSHDQVRAAAWHLFSPTPSTSC